MRIVFLKCQASTLISSLESVSKNLLNEKDIDKRKH